MFARVNLLYTAIATALFVIGVYGYGYYSGYSNQKEKFDAFVLQTKANAELQNQKNKQLAEKQARINQATLKEYKDAVTKLKSYYAKHPNIKWVSKPSASSCGVSEVSSPTSRVDGEAEGYSISTAGVNPVDCALDVLQLFQLQQWVEEQINLQ
jgi:hypothetical protein